MAAEGLPATQSTAFHNPWWALASKFLFLSPGEQVLFYFQFFFLSIHLCIYFHFICKHTHTHTHLPSTGSCPEYPHSQSWARPSYEPRTQPRPLVCVTGIQALEHRLLPPRVRLSKKLDWKSGLRRGAASWNVVSSLLGQTPDPSLRFF